MTDIAAASPQGVQNDENKKWDGLFDQHDLARFADDHGLEGRDRLNAWVDELTDRYCYLPDGKSRGQVVDLLTGDALSLPSFDTSYARLAVRIPNESGSSAKIYKATDAWARSEARQQAVGFTFEPGSTDRLIEDELGRFRVNVWTPACERAVPTDEETNEGADLFNTVLDHLFPIGADSDWAFNWVARKVQHPEERGVALVNVTRTMGTGREVFFKILTELIGDRWSGKMSIDDMLGKSAASNFSDHLVNKLLMFIPEAQSSNHDRTEKMEAAKLLFAPSPEKMKFNPKGKPAYTGMAYFSLFIASNNPENALPIDDVDRRFAVLQGARVPLKDNPEAKRAVDTLLPEAWRPKEDHERAERLMAGVRRHLMEYKTDREMFTTTPDTEARRRMIEGGWGEIEEALEDVLDSLGDEMQGIMFDDLFNNVRKAVPRSWSAKGNSLKKTLRRLLKNERTLQNGRTVYGYGGWFMEDTSDAMRANPPVGADAFIDAKGVTRDKGGRWRVRSLVMRASLVETIDANDDSAWTNIRGVALHDAQNKVARGLLRLVSSVEQGGK